MIEMERHFQGEDHRLDQDVAASADGEGIRVELGALLLHKPAMSRAIRHANNGYG